MQPIEQIFKLFSKVVIHFIFPRAVYTNYSSFTSISTLHSQSILAILKGVRQQLPCGFKFNFQITSDFEYFFMCLYLLFIYLLCEVSVQFAHSLFIGLFVFLLLSFECSLYNLNNKPFITYMTYKYLLLICCSSLHSLNSILENEKAVYCN